MILSDVKVIDLTHFVAGPFCTKYLADYGADVIKIERLGAGDGARRLSPFSGDIPHPEKSGLFLFLNTNKRGITLNLKSSAGIDTVKRLVEKADILVENFRPGVMAGLGLDYGTLSKLNPHLVYTSISNFGQSGPYRDYKATELVSQALGGVSLTCGLAGREPVRLAGPQSQFHAGLVAAVATMFALHASRRTGFGQMVDVSIMESEINIHELDIMSYPYSGEHHMKRNGSFVGHYPWSIYPCQDGLVAVCLNNRQWRRIGDWLGMPELSKNTEYATPAQRLARMDELEAILVPWLAQRTKEEATTSAQAARVPVLPVNSVKEMLEDRHFRARNYFVDIDHPVAGRLKYPGLPFKITPSTKHSPQPAPLLSQHNQENPQWKTGPSRERTGNPRPNRGNMAMSGLPLDGVRVLDLTISWAGPKVTQCLADMGAEVIKVESIQYVDAQRGRKRVPPGMCHYPDKEPGQRPWNRYDAANQINRNKQSITLDLNREQGRELFKKLVAVTDVVIDSFSPRVMTKFGLNYEALRAIKRDIIVMSMPAFGMTGPYRDYVSWGNMLECLVGLAAARGYPDSEPFMYHAYSDPICGLTGAFAILLALHHRAKTGDGQFVDLAQLEAFTPLSAELIFDYEMNERIHVPAGNRHNHAAPHNVYRCRGEDDWLAISVTTDQEWQGLVKALAGPYWATEAKFSSPSSRWQNQDELDGLIQAWACYQDKYKAMHLLQAAGVPAGALLSEKEQFEDPHLKQRGLFEKVTHPDAGTHFYPGTTWKLSRTPGHIRLPAPLLGEHNEFVLGGLLGLSNEEITRLKEEQIIGDEPVEGADS